MDQYPRSFLRDAGGKNNRRDTKNRLERGEFMGIFRSLEMAFFVINLGELWLFKCGQRVFQACGRSTVKPELTEGFGKGVAKLHKPLFPLDAINS